MQNEDMTKAVFLILVADRRQKEPIVTELLDKGIHLIDTVYGKGTVNTGYLMNTLGLVPEKNKIVVTCLFTYSKLGGVMKMLMEKFKFDMPNTGIAFTVPIDALSF
jgi:hypothetical protein